jgi:glycerate 2-kinase
MTASHPLPDESSLAAGAALMEFIDALPETEQLLVLLSGGASSLVEVLPAGVSLDSLQRLNHWFLASGVDIVTGNEIRKRLSLIKGGRLAQRLWPRRVKCLTISDVPGDDPASIASGPLSGPRPFDLPAATPGWINDLIASTAQVDEPMRFDHVDIEMVASVSRAMHAAADSARRLGYDVVLHRELLQGDVIEAGPLLAQALEQSAARTVHIWGGETTVRLPDSPGRGGRNQSLALATAIALAGHSNEYFLAAGTDGTDGPGEDAGAVVDGDTVTRGLASGINVADALRQADAGTFLEAAGDLIATGATGTNVMDLAIGMKQ